jgi:hypothetical protein
MIENLIENEKERVVNKLGKYFLNENEKSHSEWLLSKEKLYSNKLMCRSMSMSMSMGDIITSKEKELFKVKI